MTPIRHGLPLQRTYGGGVLEMALLLTLSGPPAPAVQVRNGAAIVTVTGHAHRYRVLIRAAGASWQVAATSQNPRMRIRLTPGRYKARAQRKRRRWGPVGAASGWFRMGTPQATPVQYPGDQIWVDPVAGDDAAAGGSTTPVRTVTEAWRRIPEVEPAPVVIMLRAGEHTAAPNYWENRRGGTIALVAADGPGTASLREDINMFRVANLTIDGVRIHRRGDVFHCERCTNITLRRVDFDGLGTAHETIKVNQSDGIAIVDSRISGSYENAIDFVAVHGGVIKGNDISQAQDWCAYVKGGSASIEVRGNTIHHCGTGGFTAGQGSGLEYMVAPWLTYEAMDIGVYDNLIHDTEGAGLGVNGGFHIRMSDNVLVRVGSRSHTVEFVHGARSCDGDVTACQVRTAAGGWGAVGMDGQYIPNRDVWFGNNVIANPAGQPSRWQQVTVAEDVTPPPGSNVPNPARADDGLVITNNIFWNQAPDSGYPLAASNRVNTVDPRIDPQTLRPSVTLAPVPVPP